MFEQGLFSICLICDGFIPWINDRFSPFASIQLPYLHATLCGVVQVKLPHDEVSLVDFQLVLNASLFTVFNTVSSEDIHYTLRGNFLANVVAQFTVQEVVVKDLYFVSDSVLRLTQVHLLQHLNFCTFNKLKNTSSKTDYIYTVV